MLMGKRGIIWLMMGLMLVMGKYPVGYAQVPTPIEVFAQHNRADQTITVYFTNAVSGLSTPVVLAGFRPELYLLEHLTLIPSGVLFYDTTSRQVSVALPSGQVMPHPFIPQQRDNLAVVDWVVSSDRQSIAWVEVFPNPDAWLSKVYIADINGNQITPLPDLSASQVNTLGRFLPIAITNDRQALFYDAAYPVGERPASQFFRQYTELGVYRADVGGYQTLPNEPACVCGGAVSADGASMVRLRPTAAGFDAQWQVLSNGSSATLPFSSAITFAQAGDLSILDALPFGIYTQAQNLTTDDPNAQFALILIDFTTLTQRYLLGPSAQRFRVVGQDDSETLILAEVYEGGTYKMSIQDGQLTQLSDNIWLGTLYQ